MFQRIPIGPTVADYRTSNLLILLAPVEDFPPVTAEVASSSLAHLLPKPGSILPMKYYIDEGNRPEEGG